MGSKGSAVTGYKYYMDMHMVLGYGPVDSIDEIYVGDRLLTDTPITGSSTVYMDKPELFGGTEREGGVQGYVDFEFGEPTQSINAYLAAAIGGLVPAFRGVLGVILKSCYLTANNPYIKQWMFLLNRRNIRTDGTTQWQPSYAAVGDDMNGVHIIRECLTDTDWGMGYSFTFIDETSFLAAAIKIHSEGLGISFYWANATSIEEFVMMVLEHIDATLYIDPQLGKFVIKLIRDDYVVGDLDSYDESNVLELQKYDTKLWGETINTMTVVYTDFSNRGKDNSVTVHNQGNITMQGGVVPKKKAYPGITNSDDAAKIAARDLMVLSSPLRVLKMKVNRKAWNLNIGGVFKFSWAKHQAVDVVFRVGHVDFGELLDGTITVDAIEDVFARTSNVYLGSQANLWSSPNTTPVPLTYQSVLTASYWDIANNGFVNLDTLDDLDEYLMTFGYVNIGDYYGYRINVSPDGAGTYIETGSGPSSPYCTLASTISAGATVIPYQNGANMAKAVAGGKHYIYLDGECMRIDSIDTVNHEITVGRGCIYSVPKQHTSGAVILFPTVGAGWETLDQVHTAGEDLDVKLLPKTSLGTLPIASATQINVTVDERSVLPYPAAHLLINSVYNATDVNTATVTVDWSGRNRLIDTADLIDDSVSASSTEEAGTSYIVNVYNQVDSLVFTDTVSAPTRTTSFANNAAWTTLRIQVLTLRDGHYSEQYPEITVTNSYTP